jgi:hypothetical protein
VRPSVLNLLTIVALVPSVVLGVTLTRAEPDAAYRLGAVVGVMLLTVCTAPLALAIVSTVVARRDVRAARMPGVVGLAFAVVLAFLTVPPFVDRLVAWMH